MPTMQMSGEVVISVNAIVAPGREQEFLHVMSTAASESRMEPGCVCFHVSKLPGERAYMFYEVCLLYTSPSPRDQRGSRMPSSA